MHAKQTVFSLLFSIPITVTYHNCCQSSRCCHTEPISESRITPHSITGVRPRDTFNFPMILPVQPGSLQPLDDCAGISIRTLSLIQVRLTLAIRAWPAELCHNIYLTLQDRQAVHWAKTRLPIEDILVCKAGYTIIAVA